MLDSSLWTPIEWPVELQPMLVVAVDTEAEFDWASSTSRRAAGVRSIERLTEVQDIFNRYNVRPTLVLDYPVSSTPESYKRVRGLFLAGNCEIGAHLQPWDTPPFLEETTDRNSYPGNLPPELEREKLSQLTEAIHLNIGVKPRVYKAGRYGIGASTARILRELGYEIDLSVLPYTNLSREAGPNFSHIGAQPYWFGSSRSLLEIPLSIDFTGPLARLRAIAPILTGNPILKNIHLPGVLSLLRLLDRVTLTPEGVTLEEQRRLVRAMLRRGHRVFSLAYHSSSLSPGNTPYVRNPADLKIFLQRIDQFLNFFIGEVGGRPATPFEIRDEALKISARSGRGLASAL
jgi:hypothetical protein